MLFEVHTEMSVEFMVFWNLTSCSLVDGTSLKMEAEDYFETLDLPTKLSCGTSQKTIIFD
jgi:hypothetical protein